MRWWLYNAMRWTTVLAMVGSLVFWVFLIAHGVAAQTFEQRIENLENRVTEIFVEQAQTNSDIATLKANVTGLQDVTGINGGSVVKMQAGFQAMDERLSRIEEDVSLMKSILTGVAITTAGTLVKMLFDVVRSPKGGA